MNIKQSYSYCDEKGKLVSQVCRLEPKNFRQRKPDGNGGWDWSVNGARKVPYHLDEIAEADNKRPIYVVEGEKDVDRLREEGLLATCNAGGAGKWTSDHSGCLKNRHVAIIPDNDIAGRKHAQKVAESLQGVAKSIKVVELPDLPEKGDVSDWLDNGGTRNQLISLRKQAKKWVPTNEPQTAETTDGDIVDGERNNALFTLACKLRGAGLSEESVERSLLAENEARCKPPLNEAEVRNIVGSAFQNNNNGGTDGKKGKADILLGIAKDNCVLWHTKDGTGYATIKRNGHQEHVQVKSKKYRKWLGKVYYDKIDRAVPAVAIVDAVNTLEGIAEYDGPCHDANIRVAGHDGCIYIDLGDDAWRAIEVDKKGWRIVNNPPVRFRRPELALPLPVPERGGSVDELRRFVNVKDEQWPLLLCWQLSTFCPWGTYAILKLIGEQGAGKSTNARSLRANIDPCTAPTRAEPSTIRDLTIAAENGWIVAFDNLSFVKGDLSDALCRLSTGGGFGVRTLYENNEETVFYAKRPIILNGIEDIGVRSDLTDRSIVIELQRFGEGERMAEEEYDRQFEEVRPRILGALLDAVSAALRNIERVRKQKRDWPRMVDFAQWGTAAEAALGLEPGQFLEAYEKNRTTASLSVLESTPLVTALFAMLRKESSFEGTATELLKAMGAWRYERQKGWPKTPRTLSGMLTRLAPNLRAAGIAIEKVNCGRGDGKRKVWKIQTTDDFETDSNAVDYDPPKRSLIRKGNPKGLVDVLRTGKGVNS